MPPVQTDLSATPWRKVDVLAQLRANFGSYTSDIAHASQCLINVEQAVKVCEALAKKPRSKDHRIGLQNQRRRLSCQIDQLKSLLAPIRKLPPEITGRIFSFCCLESELAKRISCNVVRLSQVCYGWRELARSTPALWSSISIDLSQSLHSLDTVQAMVTTHLSLSKQRPLCLILIADGLSDLDIAKVVLERFIKHCSRWESIALHGPVE
ncbi:hypothetical protein D9758_005025 [Tetrapyrgos nigripes]|uniref:F-box domain-containing protein n=1 Tax=Tetrapyrgos nigripes TaxID=182062 RepID=A0A8H5LWJ8_9AGAR|nr:hypothetical protein D9758_005025 [Tetrapyrgos nigripes]